MILITQQFRSCSSSMDGQSSLSGNQKSVHFCYYYVMLIIFFDYFLNSYLTGFIFADYGSA